MNEQERQALRQYFQEQRRHLIAQVRACETMLAMLEPAGKIVVQTTVVETEAKTGYNITKQS